MIVYQIIELMEGVVQVGIVIVVKEVGKFVVGKIGIINEVKDVWFVGFLFDVVVVIYMGYDKLCLFGWGNVVIGGYLVVLIVCDFFKFVLVDKFVVLFKVLVGIKLVCVVVKIGMCVGFGEIGGIIFEVFKLGMVLLDNYFVIGVVDVDGCGGILVLQQ